MDAQLKNNFYIIDLYQQLEMLPANIIGEILSGQLHTMPRPGGRHVRAESVLSRRLGTPFDDGIGGPGGWWILSEPEVHFFLNQEVAVPDLAGWRRERLPNIPESHRFTVVPDWLCEILLPATASKDREIKMPLYAKHQVSFMWLIDPHKKTLEAFALQENDWKLLGQWHGDALVSVAPFEEINLNIKDLWLA